MYVRLVNLSFMNDFSTDAASNLLVELEKETVLAAGILLRMAVDGSGIELHE